LKNRYLRNTEPLSKVVYDNFAAAKKSTKWILGVYLARARQDAADPVA